MLRRRAHHRENVEGVVSPVLLQRAELVLQHEGLLTDRLQVLRRGEGTARRKLRGGWQTKLGERTRVDQAQADGRTGGRTSMSWFTVSMACRRSVRASSLRRRASRRQRRLDEPIGRLPKGCLGQAGAAPAPVLEQPVAALYRELFERLPLRPAQSGAEAQRGHGQACCGEEGSCRSLPPEAGAFRDW